MKYFFTLFFLFAATITNAKNYYISSTGNDANTGLNELSPWKTINKLNTSFGSIAAGDSILFKKGDTFYGTILVGKSGTRALPIIISAYGTGIKPTISGFTNITGWVNEGGGIYSKIIASEGQTNMVAINSKQYAMGRYPDVNYLTYQSFTGNTSITDNTLGTAVNWKGAEVAIRKNDWSIDRCLITNHSGNTLSYVNKGTLQNATAGFGYFIQNDLRTLTTYGEWYHNISTGKFYMYFGTTDPATTSVRVATLNYLLINNNYDNITIDNINFTGSIDNTINFIGTNDYCVIKDCSLSFSGRAAVVLAAGTGSTINNNTINICNKTGIWSDANSTTITHNTVLNIGTIAGQAFSGCEGIYSPGYGVNIKYNTIRNVGYNGVTLKYLGAGTIQYNFIDSTCTIMDDGAGIYTSGTDSIKRLIDHNIITNVIGNSTGTTNNTPISAGIYLDEVSTNVTVSNNSIANVPYAAIKLHKAHDNKIISNTNYNNSIGIFSQDDIGGTTVNVVLNKNIVVAKTATQMCIMYYSNQNDIQLNYGASDSNYYVRPINDNSVLGYKQPNTSYMWVNKTITDWRKFTNQDANTKKSPMSITDLNDLRFEYNETNVAKTVTLDAKYIGIDSIVYSNGTIILQPYSSVVLIKTGIIETGLKADAGTDISLVLPVNYTILKGSAIGTINSYSWRKISGPSQFTIASPNTPSTAISNLSVGKYTFQLKVVNTAGDSALSIVNVTQSGVLPVTLIDFTAKNNNDKVNLQWQVASEINVSHYAIERSSNGQDFENIGELNANNLANIQINYNFADNFPLKGINFYRLIMIDIDGSINYSKTVSASVKNIPSFTLFNLGLSASNSSIKTILNSNSRQVIGLVVADISGRIIFTNQLQLQKGFNAIDKKIPALNTGIYYAKLFTEDMVITKTLLSTR